MNHCAVCSVIVSLLLSLFSSISVIVLMCQDKPSNENPTDLSHSCNDIIQKGNSKGSGVYTILDSSGAAYSVYCDMELGGGGWTLVASIHENNLMDSGRCTTGDKWSSEQGPNANLPKGDSNFMNRNTFGQVYSATSDDYKNPGYFNIHAYNIMIWEVPNNTPLNQIKSGSIFQYRTYDNFLAEYGGNLYNLYKIYFPIESGTYTWPTDNGISVPIYFDEGYEHEVREHFGPNTYQEIEGGYIQFRVLSSKQDVYALCPGVRIKPTYTSAQFNCIGSTGKNYKTSYCGDFSGLAYSGYGTHTGWSASLSLVESTFLIFYR